MGAVSIRELAGELDCDIEGVRVFVNRVTGEVCTTADPDSDVADGLEDEDFEKLENMLASADWVEAPARESHEEHRWMERFALSLADEARQDQLLDAIKGRGAFGRFKNAIARLGVREEWFKFKDEAMAREAASWLEAHEIPSRP